VNHTPEPAGSFCALTAALLALPGVQSLGGPLDQDPHRCAVDVEGVAFAVEAVGDAIRVLCCLGTVPSECAREALIRLLEVNFVLAASAQSARLGIDPASDQVVYLFDAPRWQVTAASLAAALRASAERARHWQASQWNDESPCSIIAGSDALLRKA